MRILDLYCKAGGCSMGYHMAGFETVGIDIEPQPNYPFTFHQGNATAVSLKWIRKHFDAVHASPPCQEYSITKHRHPDSDHPDLLGETRELLIATGLPYVIENVVGAPLIDPVRLCGSAFGLRVQRHRLFESNVPLRGISCNHSWQSRHKPYEVYNTRAGGSYMSGVMPVFGNQGTRGTSAEDTMRRSVAMGIDWMTSKELSQAIPPVYTMYLGKQLARHLTGEQ